MKLVIPIARTLLGLAFVVFSLNYFVPFLPQPAAPAEAIAFIVPFKGAGMLTLIKIIELVAGLALIANVATPLALALLAPILVGILTFHAALEPSGLPVPLALIALEIVCAWGYRAAFAPMLRLRVQPTAPATATSHVDAPGYAATRAAV